LVFDSHTQREYRNPNQTGQTTSKIKFIIGSYHAGVVSFFVQNISEKGGLRAFDFRKGRIKGF
jgi:hypothetical protein